MIKLTACEIITPSRPLVSHPLGNLSASRTTVSLGSANAIPHTALCFDEASYSIHDLFSGDPAEVPIYSSSSVYSHLHGFSIVLIWSLNGLIKMSLFNSEDWGQTKQCKMKKPSGQYSDNTMLSQSSTSTYNYFTDVLHIECFHALCCKQETIYYAFHCGVVHSNMLIFSAPVVDHHDNVS